MPQLENTVEKATHCTHCGKNLSIIRQNNLVVDGDSVFCSQSCSDLFAQKQQSPRKGRWSKTRSPFVALKKVVT